ncbi:hypothetical protein [Parafilimonas sp.]|uniref:hypothetical protein n=1 Tax=Parafilimonas sp. TaxID=1969739 RepID=UPI0039E23894
MKLILYRIFSFLLLPMAILFSVAVLLLLRAAFNNPAMFLPLFLIACIAIYTFASLNFLIRGIDGKKFLGRPSKDWLKVNAIASTVFALLMITQCTIFLMHPDMLQQITAQAKANAGTELNISDAAFGDYLRIISYFFLVYAIVLFVHIIISFQYLKKYGYLFQNEKK